MTVARLRDIAVAAFGLCFLAPLLGIVAASIMALDGRPLFFLQVRGGLHGRNFVLFKFRTMDAARDDAGALLPDEQRITRSGRFLRATRLDELPQLWNVLVGDMSLVGPRPLLAATVAEAARTGSPRNSVRPGLTGWAQVNGNTLLTDQDKIALDDWYVANRSAALDLLILGRTLAVVFFGERLNSIAIGKAHARSDHRGG